MRKGLKIAIIDDKGCSEPFSTELAARLSRELAEAPVISWVDSQRLHAPGYFDTEAAIAGLRDFGPDVIVLDLVLHEAPGRQDLVPTDWLTRELKKDPRLRGVPIIYVSNYLGEHYHAPTEWAEWAFSKHDLLASESTWNVFRSRLTELSSVAERQEGLSSLTHHLLSERSQ